VRSATIQLGDQTFTVNQDGVACAYSLNPYSAMFGQAGGGDNIYITASASGCPAPVATAGSVPTDITLSPTTYDATANRWTLPYTVAAFSSATPAERILTFTFGGQVFTVKQSSW
jgi:hypothetical protein